MARSGTEAVAEVGRTRETRTRGSGECPTKNWTIKPSYSRTWKTTKIERVEEPGGCEYSTSLGRHSERHAVCQSWSSPSSADSGSDEEEGRPCWPHGVHSNQARAPFAISRRTLLGLHLPRTKLTRTSSGPRRHGGAEGQDARKDPDEKERSAQAVSGLVVDSLDCKSREGRTKRLKD